ncbi:MAG: capsular biosynthesis protein CpsI [Legionellales bacterium]|nr:capsular biosynthesis protein CpsI [Legionellales bacterium]
MNILVTGVAGFIGFHVAKKLLDRGDIVYGLDNLNEYYDVNLKYSRLEKLKDNKNFSFSKLDISNKEDLESFFGKNSISHVVHLAAQAGVRYSIENPYAYIDSNICGFMNILEGCRNNNIKHLVYASSSSVYGANTKMPFSVSDNVDHPLSLYAATKKSNELMAHTYSYLYNIPVSGLRFFTVYGPWGRPDMALFIFTRKILQGQPIDIFNNGEHRRDFTYIDDIVEGVIRVSDNIATKSTKWDSEHPDPAISDAPYRLYNIGNNSPVDLMYFIEILENNLNKKAVKNFLPLQPGDVPATYANVDALVEGIDYSPSTSIEDGIKKFVNWYMSYYK